MEKTPTYCNFETSKLTVIHLGEILNIAVLVNFDWTSEHFSNALSSTQYLNMGVFQKGQLIGFVISLVIAPIGTIELIAIHPDKQNQGLGKLLLDKYKKEVIKSGCNEIDLEVSETNHASDFYLNYGFQIYSRRNNYYKNGSAAILMNLKNLLST